MTISLTVTRMAVSPGQTALRRSVAWQQIQRTHSKRGQLYKAFFSTFKANEPTSELQLFDSLSQRLQALPKEDAKALAWYTCGPTTYAPAHLGHARTYVCLDIVRRVMEAEAATSHQLPPLFVMNITDVDDKILAVATESNATPLEIARKYEAEFWKDMEALNCLRPHVVTRVTEYVESDIVPYIDRLMDQGMAYETEDGVYFHVRAYNEQLETRTKYGKLAPPASSEDIEVTSRARHEEEEVEGTDSAVIKKDLRDFVLWKKRKPHESVSWPSPWGEGRPGWHIECSAMIEAVQKQFQDTHQFLVHAGGVDLKFPHHTNEIAQSEAYHQSEDWIPHWVHTGHLHIDGLKMSKSLKNFISIEEFFNSYGEELQQSALESPSDDFRLWCLGLSGSYRGPATFSPDRLSEARVLRQKIFRFLTTGEAWVQQQRDTTIKTWGDEDHAFFLQYHQLRTECLGALRRDIDGSKFVDCIMDMIDKANAFMAKENHGPTEVLQGVLSTIRQLLSLVGFTDKTVKAGQYVEGVTSNTSEIVGGEHALVEQLVAFRTLVRNAALDDIKTSSDSANVRTILERCDELRDDTLPEMGIELADGASAAEKAWRPCLPRAKCPPPNERRLNTSIDLESIPLQDFFKMGQYKSMFSSYTEEGIPTHNADGSEVSKRAMKKLMKKHSAHKERLKKNWK